MLLPGPGWGQWERGSACEAGANGLRPKGHAEKKLETRGAALPTTDTEHAPPACPLEQSLASIKLEALRSHLEVSTNHTALGPTPRATLANLQGPENLHFKQALR